MDFIVWFRTQDGQCLLYSNADQNCPILEIYISGHNPNTFPYQHEVKPIPGSINIIFRNSPMAERIMVSLKECKFRWFCKTEPNADPIGFLEVHSAEKTRTLFAVPLDLVAMMDQLCTLLEIPFFAQDILIFVNSQTHRTNIVAKPRLVVRRYV